MHNLDETTSQALFGFDLFGLLSLRIWPRGFTLAILPRWFLDLKAGGGKVTGRVAGRGLFGTVDQPHPRGSLRPFFECLVDDQARYLFLGRLRLELDRKSWAVRKGVMLEG